MLNSTDQELDANDVKKLDINNDAHKADISDDSKAGVNENNKTDASRRDDGDKNSDNNSDVNDTDETDYANVNESDGNKIVLDTEPGLDDLNSDAASSKKLDSADANDQNETNEVPKTINENLSVDEIKKSPILSTSSDKSFSDSDDNIFRTYTEPKVDRHGFVVSHQMHSKVASLPNPAITGEIGKRRELKWLEMLHDWSLYVSKRSSKLKQRCQKGIPQSVRSLAWQHLSGAVNLRNSQPNLYDELIKCKEADWTDTIKKDIPRTFRHHCMFYKNDSQGQENLYNVLLAYSIYDESVGYNQALAPIAAVLLMHMPPDETFWMLVSICKNYLPGYYGERMEAMRLDGLIFAELLKTIHPDIFHHMEETNVDPLMYLVEWMVCIFARCLPFQTVLRVWDMFFCEGVKVLFKVALSILKLLFPTEKDMVDKDDFATTQLLHNLPKECSLETVLIPEAIKLNISEKLFERIHKRIIKEYPELSITRYYGGLHD